MWMVYTRVRENDSMRWKVLQRTSTPGTNVNLVAVVGRNMSRALHFCVCLITEINILPSKGRRLV